MRDIWFGVAVVGTCMLVTNFIFLLVTGGKFPGPLFQVVAVAFWAAIAWWNTKGKKGG